MDDSHVSRLHDSEDYGVPESNGRDRLSELPNWLILIILSLLQMRDVDSWLLFAIEKQVEELSLHFANFRKLDSGYCLPQSLYSCSSITKLSFSHLKLRIEENVQWDGLKSLKIVGLSPLSADGMSRLLSGAPCLEELVFCNGSIAEKFHIRSTSLKTLFIEVGEVYGDSELRIWAPNLLTLKIKIHDGTFSSCFLDVPSLIHAVLCFADCPFGVQSLGLKRIEMFNQVFQSVCHAENVTLSRFGVEFLLLMKKKGRVVQFSNAKFLNLYSDDRSHLDVREMFPNLMMLTSDGEDKGDNSFQPKTTLSLRDLLELY